MPTPSVFLYNVYDVFSVQAELDDPCRNISELLEIGASPQVARTSWSHTEAEATALFEEALDDFLAGLDPDEDEFLDVNDFELQITWSAPGAESEGETLVRNSWVYEWVHPFRPEYNGLADFMVVVQERSIASD